MTIIQDMDKVTAMQEQKLQELLQYVSQHSPFYKELFAKHNIAVSDIRTVVDLTKIPTTGKDDLQKRMKDRKYTTIIPKDQRAPKSIR